MALLQVLVSGWINIMGTRSNIAIKNKDGTVEVIYCHWDGYVSHNGKILTKHYSKVTKLRKLISLGDISRLAAELGSKTDFDNPTSDQVVAYGRDRGELDTKSRTYASIEDYIKEASEDTSWIEFFYIFDVKNKLWYYSHRDNLPELFPLSVE